MIHEVNQQQIPSILSNATQIAYEKVKSLILKIFSLIKEHVKQKNIKEEFYNSYIDFARKLDDEGFYDESYGYMDICAMYYDLMDRPKDLIMHEDFFKDLFNAFDELLIARINNSDDYEAKSEEFLMYCGKMQEYYYTEVAIPSPHYDEETCKEIIGNFAGDFDEKSIF